MKVIVLIRDFLECLGDLQYVPVFDKQKILDITAAKLDNLGIWQNQAGEANGRF